MTLDELLARLDGVKRCGPHHMARCPGHEDRGPSLSVREEDGKILVHCFAGCTTRDVVDALGLELRDLFTDDGERDRAPWAKPSRPAPKPERYEGPWSATVRRVWNDCVPVGDDPEVRAFLDARGIAIDRVELGDLARALPRRPSLTWHFAIGGKSWLETGHKLVLPCWSPTGELAALHARCIVEHAQKTLWPIGTRVRGVTFANDVALLVLRGEPLPWWSRNVAIVEGATDFLALATQASDADELAPAVLGLAAGTWSPELAARVPDGALALIATDDDEAGDRYAETVADDLEGRCVLRRWKRHGQAAA